MKLEAAFKSGFRIRMKVAGRQEGSFDYGRSESWIGRTDDEHKFVRDVSPNFDVRKR
jgi:hypothetical protein